MTPQHYYIPVMQLNRAKLNQAKLIPADGLGYNGYNVNVTICLHLRSSTIFKMSMKYVSFHYRSFTTSHCGSFTSLVFSTQRPSGPFCTLNRIWCETILQQLWTVLTDSEFTLSVFHCTEEAAALHCALVYSLWIEVWRAWPKKHLIKPEWSRKPRFSCFSPYCLISSIFQKNFIIQSVTKERERGILLSATSVVFWCPLTLITSLSQTNWQKAETPSGSMYLLQALLSNKTCLSLYI